RRRRPTAYPSRPPHLLYLSFLMTPPPPRSTLFPYTTLFRSELESGESAIVDEIHARLEPFDDVLSGTLPAEALAAAAQVRERNRSEEHTSELQSLTNLVCRLLLEKKKKINNTLYPHHRQSHI